MAWGVTDLIWKKVCVRREGIAPYTAQMEGGVTGKLTEKESTCKEGEDWGQLCTQPRWQGASLKIDRNRIEQIERHGPTYRRNSLMLPEGQESDLPRRTHGSLIMSIVIPHSNSPWVNSPWVKTKNTPSFYNRQSLGYLATFFHVSMPAPFLTLIELWRFFNLFRKMTRKHKKGKIQKKLKFYRLYYLIGGVLGLLLSGGE